MKTATNTTATSTMSLAIERGGGALAPAVTGSRVAGWSVAGWSSVVGSGSVAGSSVVGSRSCSSVADAGVGACPSGVGSSLIRAEPSPRRVRPDQPSATSRSASSNLASAAFRNSRSKLPAA